MPRDSIAGYPNFFSYNEWLEDYQNEIFEDTSYFEKGPDGEFIYEDHFDSLYSDDEIAIEAPEAEGTSSVVGPAECLSSRRPDELPQHDKPTEGTEVCFCEICGAVGHASTGCPILTDPQFDWWKGTAMEPVPPVEDPFEPSEETRLEYNVSNKSGVSFEGPVMDVEKPLVQNSTFPLNDSLISPCELVIFYIFIIFTILMDIYFPGKDEDQHNQDEEEHSEDMEFEDPREIVELEENLTQEAHYPTKHIPLESVFQANEDDVNFILPSFLSASSSTDFHGGIEFLFEEENNRKNMPVNGDDVNFILPSYLNISSSTDFHGGIEFLFEEENNRETMPEEKEEEKPITHLDTAPLDDQPTLSLGDPEEEEEYQSMEAPSKPKNSHLKWDKPPESPERSMHCPHRSIRAVRHGQKKFPYDRG